MVLGRTQRNSMSTLARNVWQYILLGVCAVGTTITTLALIITAQTIGMGRLPTLLLIALVAILFTVATGVIIVRVLQRKPAESTTRERVGDSV